MAGTPERPSQPLILTTEAKDRIGSYYLKLLLEKSFPYKEEYIFHHVLGSLKSEHISIPVDITDKFQLSILKWQQMGEKQNLPRFEGTPSLLFLGQDIGRHSLLDFNDATATIEIAHMSNVVDFGWPIGHRNKFNPIYLRIAGINKEQNRIVAVTYDLTKNNYLARLSCSITQEESFSLRSSVEKECTKLECKSIYSKLVSKTPTDINNPYEIPGLITKAMCEKLGYNPEMLTINFDDGLYYLGKTLYSDPRIPIGYYHSYFEEGMCIFGLGKTAKRKGHASWEIKVPEVL